MSKTDLILDIIEWISEYERVNDKSIEQLHYFADDAEALLHRVLNKLNDEQQ